MKKWGIIIIVFIILAGLGMTNVYFKSVESKRDAEGQAVQKAKKVYDLNEIISTQTYYGSHTYYIIKAKNKKNEKVIIWVPKNDKKRDMIVKKENSGMSREEVISLVQKERHPEKIKSVRLGMENDLPLWEITYVNQDNSFTYYYVNFQTGEFLKRYSIYQTS
ncbi:DUF5590 domain-containing protein [Bacillus songklensis]|uniref:DUF5590 domain-containing protein n=1 Tax=Bacillus songklensis TaxID=1069116 RepID=A0ABV8B3T7_9BACI